VTTEPKRTTDLERALADALAERNRLWAELNAERADRRELEHLRAELASIKGSRMWKVAGRYQRLKALARSARARIRQS
jgi:hypothetical protein